MTRFGNYELIVELGRGGMADVFLAVLANQPSQRFDKLVVIKRLRRHLAEDPAFVAMLMDEARLAARLNHPNVVQTNEVGEVDGNYFLAMEYLDGQPLHRVLHRGKKYGKPIPIAMTYSLLVEVLSGLHYAHELTDFDGTPLEVVHRDVSPQNVFITYAGQVKLVDFGIAKAAGRAAQTSHGIIKGKIAFMAPEQAQTQKVDRRSDVFAAGIMLWEAATGRPFWNHADDIDILRRLMSGDFVASPAAVSSNVPVEIDLICRHALAIDPTQRYETAADMQTELEAYLRKNGMLVSAREIGSYVGNLFAERRNEIRRAIEEHLGHMRSSVAPSSIGPLVLTSSSIGGRVPSPSGPPHDFGDRPSSTAGAIRAAKSGTGSLGGTVIESETIVGAMAPHRQPPPSRAPRVVVSVACALAACSAMAYAGMRVLRTPPTSATHVTAADAGAVAVSSAPPATHVQVSLRATPEEARFRIDHGPWLANPYRATLPRDSATHVIETSAPGYHDRISDVAFVSDVAIELTLDPDPSAPTARPAPLPPRPQGNVAPVSNMAGAGTTGQPSETTTTKKHVRPIDSDPPF